jgi:hypothetical protein
MGGNDSGHRKIMDTDTLRRVLSQRVLVSEDNLIVSDIITRKKMGEREKLIDD